MDGDTVTSALLLPALRPACRSGSRGYRCPAPMRPGSLRGLAMPRSVAFSSSTEMGGSGLTTISPIRPSPASVDRDGHGRQTVAGPFALCEIAASCSSGRRPFGQGQDEVLRFAEFLRARSASEPT